jgi:hypothetical protein
MLDLRDPLYHAYLVIAAKPEYGGEAVLSYIESLGISTAGNPAVFVRTYERLYTEDADEIVSRMAIRDDKKFLVLTCIDITREAQNKLLKAMEEPTPGTHLFVVLPSLHIALPTIRSRSQVVRMGVPAELSDAQAFLSLAVGERMKLVGKTVERIKDEKEGKQAALDLLDGVIAALYARDPRPYDILSDLTKMREYLFDSSPSLKQILEYVALRAPKSL